MSVFRATTHSLRNVYMFQLLHWPFLGILPVISGLTLLTQQDIRSSGNTTWSALGNPYRVQQILFIPKGSVLIIEPGVRLEFLPGTGLIVQGALRALGDAERRILMTSSVVPVLPSTGVPDLTAFSTFNEEVLNFKRNIRLIRGLDPSHGQIQLYYRSKWRSVCTHSYNWTAEDIRVACVQMGFVEGIFDAWVHHINDTDYMLLQRPRCSGIENSLTHCADFSSIQIHQDICEGHPDMLIRCLRHSSPIQNRHWMGIHFANASYTTQFACDRTMQVNVTQSILQHVDIFYAGSGRDGHAVSAIEANGAPPIVTHCTVQFSSFNGLNYTHTTGAVQILESKFRWNKGHGISFNSTEGNVTVRNVVSEFNAGDGIHYVHNKTFFILPDSFCTTPQLGMSQSYPVYASANRLSRNFSPQELDCIQRFSVQQHQVLTVHFLWLESSYDDGAMLELRDGADAFAPLLTTVNIRNGTSPESVATNGNRLWIRFRAKAKYHVRFNIKITAGLTKEFDLNVTNSIIRNNLGRGIAVENMRSGLYVDKVTVQENNYRAGIHVEGGSGDVNVSYAVITKNRGDGMNITYFGGRRNITISEISENQKRGVAVSFNESYPLQSSFVQETYITHSFLEQNWMGGILYGNFCSFDHLLNVTNSSFAGNQNSAVEVLSCLSPNFTVPGMLKLVVEWNRFTDSNAVAIKIRPAGLMSASIGNNSFSHHKKGVIWIQNMEYPFHDEWDPIPAYIDISENTFSVNAGPFVVLFGLSETSHKQTGILRYNYFKDNTIIPATSHIRRHQSEGVVIVGSSNVMVHLNSFDNARSPIWLSTHSRNPGKTINATGNWWGTTNEGVIYDRIFGGKDRYDLSRILFRPYLARPDLVDPEYIAPPPEYRKPFIRGNMLGGLYGDRIGSISGEYNVESDLILQPNSILTIRAGSRLLFDAGVGILSQGKIVVEGNKEAPVIFEMKLHTKPNEFLNDSDVRLVNGPNKFEGRLEIFVNGEWGTVCNEGWNLRNAGVVCRQLGWAHSPTDFGGGLLHYGPGSGSIVRSNVRCDMWDWDILLCPHVTLFEHSCGHLQDVGVKCRQPGWAGMRIPITAEQSIIEHAIFRQAGILDFDSQSVSSALQIDFNIRHRVKNCVFEENSNAGMVVLNNHLQPGNSVVEGARFRKNFGPALITHGPGLSIIDAEFIQNSGSGFLYDPKLTRYQQKELVSFLDRKNPWRTHIIPTTGSELFLNIDSNQEILLQSSARPHEANRSVAIQVVIKDMSYVLGIYALNPPSRGTTEMVRIFNGDSKAEDVEIWLLDERVNHLPATSISYKVVIEYYSGMNPSGEILLLLSPVRRDWAAQRQHATSLERCTFNKNRRAIEIIHYDLLDQHDNTYEYPRRFNNESIRITNSNVLNSMEEGLRVVNLQPWINVNRSFESAEFYLLKSLSHISYHIGGTNFAQNGAGIVMFRDGYMNVEASGNIYQWTIINSAVGDSSGAALSFDFPVSLGKRNYAMWDKRYMRAEILKLEYDQMMQKFWHMALGQIMYDTPYDFRWMQTEHLRRLGYASFHASTENLPPFGVHSLQILQSKILSNRNSFLRVDGDFLRFNFTGNEVSQNSCPPHLGLLRISGMEKEMDISRNLFLENQCKFVVEFDIVSHTASTGRVPANFILNDVRKNRGNVLRTGIVPDTNPDSYGIAVKGLQRINVTLNLLDNPGMEYEFISGLLTDRLDMEMEVRYNWWGSQESSLIRHRIFDFDDWNCYAQAQFSPFLQSADFSAAHLSGLGTERVDTNAPSVLGGRLSQSLVLTKRRTPYVVDKDLTILPGVTVTIESGVRVEFLPNVGILVLGNLKAVGIQRDPVVFAPVSGMSVLRARLPIPLSQVKYVSDMGNVRLFGGTSPKEGYLEVFNTTTNQWVPVWHQDFGIRDATVVCRHLNLPTRDVQIWRGPRVEDFTFVRTWLRPFYCVGSEVRIHDCGLPLMEMRIPTNENMKNLFIFMRCEGRHISREVEHWGGIRFGNPDIEAAESSQDESILEDVHIIAAGMLHGQKATGAVEIIQRNPRMERVRIVDSASNGVTVINPTGNLVLHHITVENSVLVGVNILLLHGDLKGDSLQSTFDPIRFRLDAGMGSLPPLTAQFMNGMFLGANVFGLVDICSADKIIYVRKRVLILFRYESMTLRKDCVKIFQVIGMRNLRLPYQNLPPPKVAFRLLEWNLHQSEFLPNMDFIELFEGNVYNQSDYRFMTRINATDNVRQTFDSAKETLTVHVSTTIAPNPMTYGFIAEVVTLPPPYVGINRESKLNVTSSTLKNNRRGGLHLYTTGEVNPVIAIERCLFQSNGQKVFHNFSTSYRAAYLDIQNTPGLEVHNSNFKQNLGGLHIIANSLTAATRTEAFVRGNLFHSNQISTALLMIGRSVSPYQASVIGKNYFFDNTGRFTDTIHLGKTVGNFSENQVLYNLARYNLFLDGFDNARLTDYHIIHRNSFLYNLAYGRPELNLVDFRAMDKATIFASGSGQTILENVINNPNSDLDLHVANQTELFPTNVGFINASSNYWGTPLAVGVAGRIKDKSDDRWLHEVEFVPFYPSNTSLMDGKCYPGFTLVMDSCYLYVGGVATFSDALLFCKLINASLPYADKLEYQLTRFIREQQRNFDWRFEGAWVQSYSYSSPADKCIFLRNQRAWPADDCESPKPFICERDTAFTVVSKASHTRQAYLIAIILAMATVLVLVILLCCCLRKSKQRGKEAFRRRDSIRDSIRISRSSLAFASTMNINGGPFGQNGGPFGAISISRTNLCQLVPPVTETHFPSGEETSSIAKSSRTFNSSVEFSPDYDFFEARNDALIFDPYSKVAKAIRQHLTPSDLTFHNVAYIDGSNSRTSTRADTLSVGTYDMKPDFPMSYPEDEDDSPRSIRNRHTILLETDI